jgi:flagellar hook-basal body complex protein FliE
MSSLQISQVLAEMRALQSRAEGIGADTAATGVASAPGAGPTDFAAMLKNAVDSVAGMQNQATALADAYEAGDKSVDLTRVMLDVQKAGLAFHAVTEVRNKLIDAYQQVMNMSV